MGDYEKQAILLLAAKILKSGFRPFVSGSGTHGFFTDAGGSKLVSFQYDPLYFPRFDIVFFGNYKTSKPLECGTGWRIECQERGDLRAMFHRPPPHWALKGATSRPTTLVEYLALFGDSSRFEEVTNGQQDNLFIPVK